MMTYLRRLVILFIIVLPIMTVALAVGGVLSGAVPRSYPLEHLLSESLSFVTFFGALTSPLFSVAHTFLSRRFARSGVYDVLLGTALGTVTGALTPTIFTGLLHPPAIFLGALGGTAYGFIAPSLSPDDSIRGAT